MFCPRLIPFPKGIYVLALSGFWHHTRKRCSRKARGVEMKTGGCQLAGSGVQRKVTLLHFTNANGSPERESDFPKASQAIGVKR